MIEAYSDRSLNIAAAQERLGRIAQLPASTAGSRSPRRRIAKGEDLACQSAGVLLSGWSCQHRTMEGGERHIFGVLLPGDVVSAGDGRVPSLTQIAALSPVEVADLEPVGQADGLGGGLMEAERRLTEARYLDQMTRLGGLSALRATGHLALELHDRLASVGLARNGRFHLPIGQRVIAAVLGLSAVHINRTLQMLARDGLVASGAGWMAITDRKGLSELVACPTAFGQLSASFGLLTAADPASSGAEPVPASTRKVS